jgi:hypothetical protein
MMTGDFKFLGSLNEELLKNIGIFCPGVSLASQVDATPLCTLPVGMVSFTTAQVMCTEDGCILGDDEIE